MNQLVAENILPESGLSMRRRGSPLRKGSDRSPRGLGGGRMLAPRLIKLLPSGEAPRTLTRGQLQAINLYSVDQLNIELRRGLPQRTSDFGYQLQQRKKLRWFYGALSTGKLRKVLQDTQERTPLVLPQFLQEMEQRLDVILYRSGLLPSVHAARQWILHQRILINGRPALRPGYRAIPGDLISIDPRWQALLGRQIFERVIRFLGRSPGATPSRDYPNLRELSLPKAIQGYSVASLERRHGESLWKSIDDLFDLRTHGYTSRYYLKARNSSKLFRALAPMKPMHIEVSYRTLSIVYLYKPQKIAYPTVFDIQAIQRSY